MPYEHKENSASLFKEEDKKNENGPDYTGDGLIEGKRLRLAAWINESKGGKKYLSIQFSEPRERQEQPASKDTDLKEDVPF